MYPIRLPLYHDATVQDNRNQLVSTLDDPISRLLQHIGPTSLRQERLSSASEREASLRESCVVDRPKCGRDGQRVTVTVYITDA